MKKGSIFLLQLLIALSCSLKAGDETRSSRVYANQIGPWAFVQSHDDKFNGSGGWNSGFFTYNNRAVIELGLNEDKHLLIASAVKICAKFDVQVTDASMNVATYTNLQLDINYDPAELSRYKDKVQMVFSPAYKIKVYNISITQCPISNNCSACTTPYTKADVYIQTDVYSEKIYNFNFASTFNTGDVSHILNATTQQLDIAWHYVSGAEEYELEYTYVDSYTGTFGTYLPSSSVSYDLDHDATRIVTNFNTYSIPLTYETGFLIYRIRPIGTNATKQRIEGTWFGAPASGLVSGAGTFFTAVSSLQSDALNWQSIKTFAEHGKTGTGVNYTDALGVSRQSLARLNTVEKTMVQSTLYDYYARPTINILPTPVSGTNFNYRFGLNTYLAGIFDKSVFGLCTGGTGLCSTSNFQLDVTNGASNYYSPSNPNQQAFQGYLPDAEGMPYTRVKYLPDARGKITHQTMPGLAHSLGSNKEMRYFYTQPTQVELDRLFGAEAGRAKFYNKNIAIDPNGQVNTNYQDMYGRTVATSLLGKKPLNVDALPNITGTLVLTEDLALSPTNDLDPVNRCKEVNANFFVSSAGTEGYIYHTTLGSFVSPCDALKCYNCVYDLELSIKDECGTEIFDHDNNNTTAPGLNILIGSGAPYGPTTCGTGPTGIQIAGANLTTPVTITFPRAGVYTVRKKICVSDAPMADYTQEFIKNSCDNKKCALVDSIISETDFSGCEKPVMTCAQCLTELQAYMTSAATNETIMVGTMPNTVAVQSPSMTPQQLSQAMENCEKLCPPKSRCDKYTQLLLADFYPGTGQYAALSSADPKWSHSIFNAANSLTNSPTYSTPPSPYQNFNNTNDYVLLPNATSATAPENLSQADFITYFKKSWAKSFLNNHPENCKLYFNCNILGLTQDYNDAMSSITHFDTACASGYLVPVLATFSSFSVQGCASTNADPIMALATAYPGFATAINNFTTELATNFNGSGVDIYRYVVAQSIPSASNTNTGNYVGDDPCRADIDWLKFKSFYQSKKFALIQNLMAIYNANPASYGYTGPRCGYVSAPFKETFPDFNELLNANIPGSSTIVGTALNGPPNFNNTTAVSTYTNALATFTTNVTSNLSTTLTTQCAIACESYTTYWNNTLNTGCPAYSSASQTIKNKIIAGLKGVCEQGCDYTTNLMGASTTSPSTSHLLAGTAVYVTSFQGVLDHFLGSNVCSSVLLSQPAPYPTSGIPTTNSLTSCKCDLILQVEADFAVMTPTPNITSAWQLFRKQYGFDLVDYNILKCVCKKATNNAWTTGYSWTNTNLTALAQYTIPVNPKIQCYTCLSCSDVVNAISAMQPQLPVSVTSFPDVIAAITTDSTNHIFAVNYLNNLLGPHPFQEYIDLYEDCNSFQSTGTFSNTLTDEAFDLFHYMNQLVSDGLINKTSTRPAKLCTDSKYFLSSLYKGSLPIPSAVTYNYNVTTSGQGLQFTITNNLNVVVLSVSLTGPVNVVPATWNTFISLSNMVAWCPSPVNGSNYSFKVSAMDNAFNTYIIDGTVNTAAFPISYLSASGTPTPVLCPKKPRKKNTCTTTLINNALTQANQLAQYYTEAEIIAFQNGYKDQCYASINETFKRQYNGADEYNYTLYYYDEAGNLQRTVPPNGVDVGLLSAVVTPLALNSTQFPAYSNASGVDVSYVSDYRFNSYNQPVKEKTVDGGETNYIYDPLGRILASQNAKQLAMSSSGNYYYSYSLYDSRGRINQTGQVKLAAVLVPAGLTYASFSTLISGAGNINRKQVTRVFYDDAITTASVISVFTGGVQRNLRNRVSFTTYIEDYLPASSDYDHATFYSYDEHGNVSEIVNHTKQLDPFQSGAFKKLEYEYELVSAKVTKCIYQKGKSDQFIHKYYYDNDNRILEVYTSKDDLNWDRDAKYFYYDHGPLARIERADKQVQGSDYFYTIHGWIKGLNSNALTKEADAGKDAAAGTAYLSSYPDVHKWTGGDAMSYGLNYYNVTALKDYKPIKSFSATDLNPSMSMANLYNNTSPFFLDDPGALGTGNGASLYNGNISSMVTSFINKDQFLTIPYNTPFPLLTAYRYDQLQRLTKSRAYWKYTGNTWDAPVTGSYYDTYRMDLSYDFNGNIKTLFRNGTNSALKAGTSYSMDNLTYGYKTVLNGATVNSNQLYGLKDLGTAANYSEDIEAPSSAIPSYNTSTNRFNYDAIGNLISDKGEYISLIEWTIDRKVRRITRDQAALVSAGVTKSDIEYEYNASRQRAVKIEKPRDPVTKALTTPQNWLYTFYSYDASGNVMAVYSKTYSYVNNVNKNTLALSEHHIYGSDRLALCRPSNTLSSWSYTWGNCTTWPGWPYIPCDGAPPQDDESGDGPQSAAGPGGGNPPVYSYTPQITAAERLLGYKEFELNNHLHNVIATVSDRKIWQMGDEIVNNQFNSGIDGWDPWNTVNSSGQLAYTAGGQYSGAGKVFATVPGTTYRIRFNLTKPAGSLIEAEVYALPVVPPFIVNVVANNGANTFYFTATSAQSWLRIQRADNNPGSITYYIDNVIIDQPTNYLADILMHTDYYAFGQQMPSRTWIGGSNYRYGFNGKERADEINSGDFDFGNRILDSRIGRWLTWDPLRQKYPFVTPYCFSLNNPISLLDPDGNVVTPADERATMLYNNLKIALQNSNDEKSKAMLCQLETLEKNPEVNYVIHASAEIPFHEGDNSGVLGVTRFDFENSTEESAIVNIYINKGTDPSQAYGALGDELTTAYEFNEGEFGFAEVPTDNDHKNPNGAFSYDSKDEYNSKVGSVTAIDAVNNLDGGLHYGPDEKIVSDIEKQNLSTPEKNKKIDSEFTPEAEKYGYIFAQQDGQTRSANDAKNAETDRAGMGPSLDGSKKIAYRKNNENGNKDTKIESPR